MDSRMNKSCKTCRYCSPACAGSVACVQETETTHTHRRRRGRRLAPLVAHRRHRTPPPGGSFSGVQAGQVGRAWPRAQAVTVTRSDTPNPPALRGAALALALAYLSGPASRFSTTNGPAACLGSDAAPLQGKTSRWVWVRPLGLREYMSPDPASRHHQNTKLPATMLVTHYTAELASLHMEWMFVAHSVFFNGWIDNVLFVPYCRFTSR